MPTYPLDRWILYESYDEVPHEWIYRKGIQICRIAHVMIFYMLAPTPITVRNLEMLLALPRRDTEKSLVNHFKHRLAAAVPQHRRLEEPEQASTTPHQQPIVGVRHNGSGGCRIGRERGPRYILACRGKDRRSGAASCRPPDSRLGLEQGSAAAY
jgi:hypothetical protein